MHIHVCSHTHTHTHTHTHVQGAAPYLATQQVWMAIMGLIKIIQYDPSSFLACVDTLAWVAAEALTPLNFAILLQVCKCVCVCMCRNVCVYIYIHIIYMRW